MAAQRVSTTSGCDDVKCPFFKGHSAHEIHCEGIIDECREIIRFKRACDKDRQMHVFCETFQYEKCELYRAIYEAKYAWQDEEDEEK